MDVPLSSELITAVRAALEPASGTVLNREQAREREGY